VAKNPKAILDKLDQHFLLKPESRAKPKVYLGAEIGMHVFEKQPGKPYWSMGSQAYIKESVKNVETHLQKQHRELKSKVSSPLPINYSPELDATPLCDEDDVSEYHSRIGVLRWAVELGRIDICTEVSIMAAFAASPQKGHLGSPRISYSDMEDNTLQLQFLSIGVWIKSTMVLEVVASTGY